MRSDLSVVSGLFLTGALLLIPVAAGLILATGAAPAFSAQLRGSLEEVGPHIRVFTIGNILWAVAWASMLIGLAALTQLLSDAGDPYLSKLSLIAITVAAALALLEASFGFTVTPWATREAASIGVTPEIYTVLRRWVNGMQAIYIALGLAAGAGFGTALTQTGLVPVAVGRFALIWSLAWLVVLGFGIPAIVLVAPGIIGIALLVA